MSLEYSHDCQKLDAVACQNSGYLPVSGGQLALVMATTNHCGQIIGSGRKSQ